MEDTKLVIYQIFPRLFGNPVSANITSGTIEQNGCGKMSAFSHKVLREIRGMGITHVWFTGLIEHASQTAYPEYGIPADHPDVVKGRAGSPYAIRDYYDIDPDLADVVSLRMVEFEALVERCHKEGLKVIIDFVPNHVAREYHSDSKPAGTDDFGAHDKKTTSFDANNNYYYLPGQMFTPPDGQTSSDSCYYEFPARATGNNCFSANPSKNDWYETVKLNYGVDFQGGGVNYFEPVPDTWYKMRNILLFWASKKIDGFRCDMAELVPVKFWNWVIDSVKTTYNNLIFIAEVYQPHLYEQYFYEGRFDYLYDKVGLYDTLRAVVGGHRSAHEITYCWQSLGELQTRMLYFLENHDEQRIASDFFATDPLKARPAFVVAAAMNTNPIMVYAGQELGEKGMDAEGFSGLDGRTSIFDYWNVNTLHRWYNDGQIDEAKLSPDEIALRQFYTKILKLCNSSNSIREGRFFDLMYTNPAGRNFNPYRQFVWMRSDGREVLLFVANFDSKDVEISIFVPENAFHYFGMYDPVFTSAKDLLTGESMSAALSKNSSYSLNAGANNVRIIKFV